MSQKEQKHPFEATITTDIDYNNTVIAYDPNVANQTLTNSDIAGDMVFVEAESDQAETDVFTKEDFLKALERVVPPDPKS